MKHFYKILTLFLLSALAAPAVGHAQTDTVYHPGSIVSGDTVLCADVQSFTIPSASLPDTALIAPSSYQYQWRCNDTILFGSNSSSFTLSPSAQPLNRPLTFTRDSRWCSTCLWHTDSGQFTITVVPLPTVSIHATATTACVGETIVLTANASTNCAYEWSDGTTTSEHSAETTGAYSVTATDAHGCASAATQSVTINIPTHTAITRSACGSYEWHDSVYMQSGNYTYSHPDANGCTQVDTLHLTIYNPVHTAITVETCESYTWIDGTEATYTISGDYTYSHEDAHGCWQVDTLHLTINHNTEGIDEQVACETFTWIDGNTYTASTNTPTVTLTNAAGCDSIVILHLTINSSPEPFIVGETSICEGQSTNLTVYGGDSYSWSNGASGSSISVGEGGLYEVTAASTENCTATASVTVTVNPLPEVVISGENSFCAGQSTVLTASGAVTYFWNTAESADGITVSHSGTYSVVGNDANGCANTASVVVTENPIYHIPVEATICANDLPYHYVNGDIDTNFEVGTPTFSVFNFQFSTFHGCDSIVTLTLTVYPAPTPVIAGNTWFCSGEGTTLTAVGGVSYEWSTGETTNQIYVSESGTYTVTVTDVLGCNASTDIVVTGVPSELEELDIVSKNHADGTPYILVYPQADLLYQWYRNGAELPDEVRQYYAPSNGLEANVMYSVLVRLKDPDACGIIADWWWDGTVTAKLSVAPNPNDGHFVLTLPAQAQKVSIYTASGEEVYVEELADVDTVTIATGLPAGLYLLKVMQADGTVVTEKLVIRN